ncbi:(2Fe-2S) ferredoxin domain-containing protein [Chamaesiphon sp. VAR_48_metabat_403]|uniref:(2Fe-2S) ferredoxin domain-containing protein n=1 Tax=Chamaesiphon sp. VAR_48_metabat_403 TaxID=2964700 RepID=UPI00286E3B7D|nr:(2Fe-2S) ferredoxin domain-containing protein [Chamaesiphon sp. VAR_48_metabat_403]
MTVNYLMTNEAYFQLEGEFLGVCAIDGYKLKYLRLRTADRDIIIKVPKQLRLAMVYRLAIGDRLRCEGIQKDGKFKASAIEKVEATPATAADRSPLLARFSAGATEPTRSSPENEPKVKILICQKSHCHNNGGKEIYSALVAQLSSHDLDDRVTLKTTGCLKCCKQAPNLVVLPVGKTADSAASPLDRQSSYRNVSISQIPAIISRVNYHLSIESK